MNKTKANNSAAEIFTLEMSSGIQVSYDDYNCGHFGIKFACSKSDEPRNPAFCNLYGTSSQELDDAQRLSASPLKVGKDFYLSEGALLGILEKGHSGKKGESPLVISCGNCSLESLDLTIESYTELKKQIKKTGEKSFKYLK